jgi:hypothetical protein
MGVVATIPGVGQAAIGLAGLVGIGIIALNKVRQKFTGYFLVLRTIDEFAILLHKITKLIRLTVYISTTYKFDINVDEISEMLKIIFTQFDTVLKDDKEAYHEIEHQVVNSDPTRTNILNELEENRNDAIERMTDLAAAAVNQTKTGDGKNGDGKNGGNNRQRGGGFWRRFRFKVEEWQVEFNNNIIKLNIYLSTAMGEFTIILNVIQMNMLVNSIDQNNEKKDDMLKILVTNNNLITDSPEYRNMRVGILLHDILRIRIDFNFCQQSGGTIKMKDNPICSDHVLKDTQQYGVKTFNFRKLLHNGIKTLKYRLNNGDYEDEIKTLIKSNVIENYRNLLKKIIEINPGVQNKYQIDKKYQSILDDFKIKDIKQTDLEQIYNNLNDTTILELKELKSKQIGGGFMSLFNKQDNTESLNSLKQYVIDHPYELITMEDLGKFFKGVYELSKKEQLKAIEPQPSVDSTTVADTNAVAGAAGADATTVAGSAGSVKKTVGGTRRNKKRRRNSKKYTKSSSAIKRSKTYKIRI